LTDENVKGLVAIARRAERLMPDCNIHLETVRLRAVSPGALQVLTEAGIETTEAPHLRGQVALPQPETRTGRGTPKPGQPHNPQLTAWPLMGLGRVDAGIAKG
jgi:hypothetical protein